jgi:putative oxidoreductase
VTSKESFVAFGVSHLKPPVPGRVGMPVMNSGLEGSRLVLPPVAEESVAFASIVEELMIPIQKLHALFVKAASSLQSPLLLVVRLYWGWQLSQTGWGKLHSLPRVTEFFGSLGIPAPGPTALFIAVVEFVGGILLALGCLSRMSSLVIAVDMIMAYVLADREALFSFFSDPGKFYNADPYTFLFAALLVLIFGPGKLSVDTLAERLFAKGEVKQTQAQAQAI